MIDGAKKLLAPHPCHLFKSYYRNLNFVYVIKRYLSVLITFFAIQALTIVTCSAYPIFVKSINRSEAKYDTPENAYIALVSAMKTKDVDWYYESLTQQSKQKEFELYKKYKFDITKKFESLENVQHILVMEKMSYKDGVVIIVKNIYKDGSVMQGPAVFKLEDGQWKSVAEISAEDPILDHLEYTPAPEYFVGFKLLIFPDRWNISRYSCLSSRGSTKNFHHHSKKSNVLFVILPKDNEEFSVGDILPETLRLNFIVEPSRGHSLGYKRGSSTSQCAYIVSSPEEYVGPNRQGIGKCWNRLPASLQGRPVMLVHFNQFEALKTLPNTNPGKEYEIAVTGKLKNGSQFKATASIILVDSKSGKGNKRKHHRPRFH